MKWFIITLILYYVAIAAIIEIAMCLDEYLDFLTSIPVISWISLPQKPESEGDTE